MSIKVKTFKNGMRVVTEPLPYVKSVSMGIWVKTGAVNEPKRIAGISHYIEHMMFKGTEKRTAKQLAEDVDRIAGNFNAFTGKEATCYYLKTLATNFEKGFEILSDMMVSSVFDQEELEKERQVICEEIKMIEDTPEDDVHDMACEAIFHGNSYAKSIIGTPSSLNSISRKTIKQYLGERYTTDNIVVSVAGCFDEAEVIKLIEKYLSGLPEKSTGYEFIDAPYEPRFRSKAKDIEQSHICIGTKGIAQEDERYYSLALLNNIMGSSMSSRFFQNIREEKGLAYSVYSMASSFKDDGYYNIYAAVSHDKVKAAIEAIGDELSMLKKDGITKDELAMAKEQMKGQYIFGMENVNGRMFSIGKNLLVLDRVFTPEEIIKKLDKVTMKDIADVSELITNMDLYSGAVVGRKKVGVKQLIKNAIS